MPAAVVAARASGGPRVGSAPQEGKPPAPVPDVLRFLGLRNVSLAGLGGPAAPPAGTAPATPSPAKAPATGSPAPSLPTSPSGSSSSSPEDAPPVSRKGGK
jgi:hypothetical protein